MSERIVSVAIMLGEDCFVAPVKGEGRHGELIAFMARAGVPTPIVGKQGFQTSKKRFVDRREAFYIAEEAGQIKPLDANSPAELFSEDLW